MVNRKRQKKTPDHLAKCARASKPMTQATSMQVQWPDACASPVTHMQVPADRNSPSRELMRAETDG